MNLNGWNQHRVLVGTLVALAAASAFGGCDKLGGKKDKDKGSATVASGSENVAPQTGPIKIGHYASLTGEEATFGISTDNGVKLAMKERNAAGGVNKRQIELKTLDDGSKATEAGNVVARLVNEDKVVALIGEVASSASIAGGKVAQDRGVPMISPSSTNKLVTKGRDMVSRVCFLDEFQGYVVAKFASEKGMKKVAILFDQAAAYSKGLAETFQTELEALGGKITTKQAYKKGDPDVSAQLQTIKTSGIDAVFLPGYYTDVGNIIRQARKIGIKQPFLGGDGWDSSALARIGGDAVEGSYYSNHYSFDEKRPEVQEFVTKYKAAYGEVPDGLAALGYDAARVLFDAMERAPSLNGRDLAAAIAATKDFAGVTGKITLDANRDAVKKAVVVQMKGGKPVYVTSVVPKGWPEEKEGAGSDAGSAAGSAAGSGSAK